MKKNKNLKKLLNFGLLDYTNLTTKCGRFDMPYVTCNVVPKIDYLATYSRPSTYFKTPNTCVSFFEYDLVFDGLFGLWNAIYYDNTERQKFFIKRFSGVKYFIAPDFSKCSEIPEIENYHRQFRSRVVAIWLSMNLKSVVIPLVSCANANGMRYMLDGMDDCKIVAFNTKGMLKNPNQRKLLTEAVQYTVERLLKLKSIVVYSSSANIRKIREYFKYAIDKGIEIQIPDNTLQTRNRILGGDER